MIGVLVFTAVLVQKPPVKPQEHPPLPKSTGTKRRYAGKGVDMFYSWSFVDKGLVSNKNDTVCDSACYGKKHPSHKLCDTSCDKTCTTLHVVKLEPRKFSYLNPFDRMPYGHPFYEDLAREIRKAGGNTKSAYGRVREVAREALDPILKGAGKKKLTYEYKSGHWNTTPCSTSTREFKYRKYDLVATWNIVKDGVPVATGTSVVYTVLIPVQKFFVGHHYVYCGCGFTVEKYDIVKPSSVTLPGGQGSSADPKPPKPDEGTKKDQRVGGVFIDREGEGRYAYATTTDLDQFSFNVSCNDLNTFAITAMNPTPDAVRFAVMPGTRFHALDSDYQDTTSGSLTQFTLPAFESIVVSVPLSSPLASVADGWMVCLNMNKEEPTPSIPYELAKNSDTRLNTLAADLAARSFKGPWDQARIWIYTDTATREEINKILFPPVTAGMYVQGLFDLATIAAVDLSDERYRQCLTPDLLLGDSAPYHVTRWYIELLESVDPEGLRRWIGSSTGKFDYLFAADAEAWYVDHAVAIAAGLCGSADTDLQKAGLRFVSSVPTGARSAFVERGGMMFAFQLLLTGDLEVVDSALAAAESYRAPEASGFLADMSSSLPQEIIDRARQLLAEFEDIGRSSGRRGFAALSSPWALIAS